VNYVNTTMKFVFHRDMKFIVKVIDCQLLKNGSDVCLDRAH